MDNNKLIEEIKDKNLDVEYFANEVIDNEDLRDYIVKQLLTNEDIMVYYHSFYIISRASELNPKLFLKYWNDFVDLLSHQNSYHRNIGLTIISNLTFADESNLFDNILAAYLNHIDDEKFMTAQCCLKNLVKIFQARRDLREDIIQRLLKLDEICYYPERQKELLKYDVLEIIDLIYRESDIKAKESMNTFIEACEKSRSNKTKKKAIDLIKKYLCE